MLARAASGLAAAAAVALLARRARALSPSGALAATLVGAAAVAAGWRLGALLVLYFVSSTLLSRLRGAEKARRTGGVVAKGGSRDALQVLANGGVFALCALVAALDPAGAGPGATLAALGALAAATADTWATEIGTLAGTPRSLRTLQPVPPGTSGGVTVAGTLAMIAGALFVAVVARALALTDSLLPVALGGTAGALTDSLIGATVQERRWCDACALGTERARHDCGAPTRRIGGLAALDNDVVNLLATLAGAAVAYGVANT
jgi:uncharacterized protein (TIGR00297 family)